MAIARPTVAEFQKHFPSTNDIARADLFRAIGWDGLIDDPAYGNTCAIRGSIGLIGCNVPLKGRMQILGGPHKGKWIEPGQRSLSLWLAGYWGAPDKKLATDALGTLAGRHGIVSHFNIHPDIPGAQGHFDVLDASADDPFSCASHCFWTAQETWFWALPPDRG
jgi:hypothetical protein